ncbi:hypothetical protein [Streptomyces sp. PSKA30]|uniref:hypothetical protein n=1 Tax=Streptomyces sp. PSKA30 TaxID=2874597 RepID=UPI001CD13F40|nr:hypothetical protein [Streptomyces sp. PSKA30]MBZ9643990.1 hypothetical protein [Streptomyces sp. PSKA30]
MNPAIRRLIAQWHHSHAFTGVRMVGAWERALSGPAEEAVLRMVLQHQGIRVDMLRCSLDLIAQQGPRQRKVLAGFIADIERLRAVKKVTAADAALMIDDLELSGRQLAALERRAAGGPKELRDMVSDALAATVRKTLGPMSEVKLTGMVSELSYLNDPGFHTDLSRIFAAGPLGEQASWARIAHVFERGFVPRKSGNLFNEVLGVTSELIGAAQPDYRRIILDKSRDIVELGLEPVEIIGESLLIKAAGGAPPLSFRDGLLLAVSTPALPFQRIGEAGLSVVLESRQATTAAETGIELARAESEFIQSRKLESTLSQQFRGHERAREAIEAGDLLLTPGGSLYRLRPVPASLSRNVLARPQHLPRQQMERLLHATATAGEHPGDVIQVATPYSSAQLRAHIGPLVRDVRFLFGG